MSIKDNHFRETRNMCVYVAAADNVHIVGNTAAEWATSSNRASFRGLGSFATALTMFRAARSGRIHISRPTEDGPQRLAPHRWISRRICSVKGRLRRTRQHDRSRVFCFSVIREPGKNTGTEMIANQLDLRPFAFRRPNPRTFTGNCRSGPPLESRLRVNPC